ncbi:hypothetical protein Hanom_Chr16g01430761 [Helianthus anomalus]
MNSSSDSGGRQLGPAIGDSTRWSETRSGGWRQGPTVLVFIRQASPVNPPLTYFLSSFYMRFDEADESICDVLATGSKYVDSDVVQVLGQIYVRNSSLGSDRVRFGQNGQLQMWFESTRSTQTTRVNLVESVNLGQLFESTVHFGQ